MLKEEKKYCSYFPDIDGGVTVLTKGFRMWYLLHRVPTILKFWKQGNDSRARHVILEKHYYNTKAEANTLLKTAAPKNYFST